MAYRIQKFVPRKDGKPVDAREVHIAPRSAVCRTHGVRQKVSTLVSHIVDSVPSYELTRTRHSLQPGADRCCRQEEPDRYPHLWLQSSIRELESGDVRPGGAHAPVLQRAAARLVAAAVRRRVRVASVGKPPIRQHSRARRRLPQPIAASGIRR
jgi:hypothetical protein